MSNNLAFITRMFEKTRHKDFTYVADPAGRDRWKVHKELDAFHGDCDDFAMTFAYRAMGRRFWVPLFKGEFELYHVDYKGTGHMICCINGTWYDNIMKEPTPAGKLSGNYTNFKRLHPFIVLLNYFTWKW